MRRYHRRRSPALLVLPLIMLIMLVTGAIVTVGTVAAAVGITLMPFIPVVLAVGLIHLVARPRRRLPGAPGTAPLPPRRPMPPRRVAPPPPRPDLTWAATRARFHALRSRYAAFECDAMAVLRLPALADVSVPSTARFVDAFAEAQALETDQFPPLPHAAAFHRAVDKAERAWQAALDAAERIRLSNLSSDERHAIERIVKLLTTARDSDSGPERLAAYSLARSELAKLDKAGVLHVPAPAQAILEEQARGQLSA